MTYQEWRNQHAFRIPLQALIDLDALMAQRDDSEIIAAEHIKRQEAQAECERLKGLLVRADLEQRNAVLAEREACAKVVESILADCEARDVDDPELPVIAAAIRARSQS